MLNLEIAELSGLKQGGGHSLPALPACGYSRYRRAATKKRAPFGALPSFLAVGDWLWAVGQNYVRPIANGLKPGAFPSGLPAKRE